MSRAARSARRRLAGLAACVAMAACIPSNVVAPTERMVVEAESAPAFVAATAADVVGFHESIDIQGDAAVSLRKVYYLFGDDGSYTGAALVDDGERRTFQTLTGTWKLTPEGLVLDGLPAAPCDAAPGQLRLTAPTGVLRLRRAKAE
jgi:hypothetical protein